MGHDPAANGGRNYGVDALRVLAMCFVVILHTLGQGGILAAARPGSAVFLSAWYLETLAFCAVDVFALISGYVASSDAPRPVKLSSWLRLWLEVVFYSLALTLVFCVLRPDAAAPRDLRGMYLPVKNNLYWYFTAYTGLFFLRPLLDAGMRACSGLTARRLFLAVFALFSCFELFTPVFKLSGGYCFAWVALLYVMGAAMRKGGVGSRMKPAAALAVIAALSAFAWAWKVFGTALPAALRQLDFVSYISPTVLGTAVCFLICFSKLRCPGWLRAGIGFAAPGAFAVYLLNTHRFVWSLVLENRFTALAEAPAAVMAAAVLGFALAFTAASVLIDRLRQLLERALRIPALTQAVGAFVTRCADRIARRL